MKDHERYKNKVKFIDDNFKYNEIRSKDVRYNDNDIKYNIYNDNRCNDDQKRYTIGKLIGSGSFGNVYELKSNLHKHNVTSHKVIKLESNPNLINKEYDIYKNIIGNYTIENYTIGNYISNQYLIGRDGYPIGFVKVYDKTNIIIDNRKYHGIIMDQLGENLETLFAKNNRLFSLSTVIKIGLQLLDRLYILHDCHLLYRDMKLENIVIGINKYNDIDDKDDIDNNHKDKNINRRILYLIDMGLCKFYMVNGKHIRYSENKSTSGTARFKSAGNLIGIESSRRDDIESLFLLLIYLLKGSLPWQSNPNNNHHHKTVNNKNNHKNNNEMLNRIANINISTSPEELCSGLSPLISSTFSYLLHCARSLKFTDQPEYENYKNILFNLAEKSYINLITMKFEWE